MSLSITKKHEIAAKLSQGVKIRRILDDFSDNIGMMTRSTIFCRIVHFLSKLLWANTCL